MKHRSRSPRAAVARSPPRADSPSRNATRASFPSRVKRDQKSPSGVVPCSTRFSSMWISVTEGADIETRKRLTLAAMANGLGAFGRWGATASAAAARISASRAERTCPVHDGTSG